MTDKVYLSNISPLWSYDRQERLLRQALPGYPDGVAVYREFLPPRERRAHRTPSLAERSNLLRPSSRRWIESIYIASLAVFAWTEGDMLACITAAAARQATVHVLDAGLVIGPNAGAKVLNEAVGAFAQARKRQGDMPKGKPGGDASARKSEERTRAAAESIRSAWARRDEKTPDLLARAGITLNTAKRYLGSRPIAQRAQDGADKRAAKRARN